MDKKKNCKVFSETFMSKPSMEKYVKQNSISDYKIKMITIVWEEEIYTK